MRKTSISILALLFCMMAAVAQTIATDPMVKTLKEEMDYNMAQLKSKTVPAYFMSLRVTDYERYYVTSFFGAASVSHQHERRLTPMVRVGSMELDNYKYSNNRRALYTTMPLDNSSTEAMRRAIWSITRECYDKAVREYEAARTRARTSAAQEDKAPCYSSAPVETYYEPALSAMTIDEEAWQERLNAATRVFKESRVLAKGEASLDYETTRKYLVNTDGTVVVQNRRAVRVMLQASIKAADGMDCPLYEDFFAFSVDSLPDEDVLVATAKDMVIRLLALRDAPVADPYAGPAILSGEASGVFFHEIFGHRLESHRMKEGGETFKKMVGARVLPEDFLVYCDPTLSHYGKQALNGHYLYDDEGVKARRVNNVVDGVLRDFLSCRIPIDRFPVSNGHGRAGMSDDPVSRQSNLVIETRKPYTDAQLRKMLRDEAKRQGKEYGYYFRTVTSGSTMLSGLNAFNVDPVEVYRVFVDESKPDQLVRGVGLIGTPLSMFSNIAAAGQQAKTFTGSCGAESGWVPVTATSPMIFVSKIETQRGDVSKSLPRILPQPDYAATPLRHVPGTDEKDVVFQAMEDVSQRIVSRLCTVRDSLPFFVDYWVRVCSQTYVVGSLGGINYTSVAPGIVRSNVDVVLGDSMVSSRSGRSYVSASLPQQLDYDVLRHVLWEQGDDRYKGAVNEFANKKTQLQNRPLPEEDRLIPEMPLMPAKEYIGDYTSTEAVDTVALQKMARELSAIFLDYPQIYESAVTFNIIRGNQYRLTSEGLRLRYPYYYAGLRVNASIIAADGSDMDDMYSLCERRLEDMISLEDMKKEVREFARLLCEKAKAPERKEYYIGPVMLEDEAVNEAFMRSVVKSVCFSGRNVFSGSNDNGMKLGKRVLDTNLSVWRLGDMESYKGIPLVGWYDIDKDGVKPAGRMPLIEKGLLRNLLAGRYPAVGAPESNGAQSWNNPSTLETGVIHVTADKTVPLSKMKKELIKEAKKSGNTHAYIIRAPKNGWRYLVRVDVKDGSEEIVRTENIPGLTRSDMMHVTAVSSEELMVNKHEMNYDAPVSVIAPRAMIIESMEVMFSKPRVNADFSLKRRGF